MFRFTGIMLLCGMTLFAQEMKIRQADVFKNGAAFITAEGSVKFSQGKGNLSEVPAALFGTLWLASKEKNVTVTEIKTVSEKKTVMRPAVTIKEILEANTGKKITWYRSDDKKNAVTGVLQKVSGTDDRLEVTIKNGSQIQVLSAYSYHALFEFPEGYSDNYMDTVLASRLSVTVSPEKTSLPMQMVYFQSQVGWVPTYYVELVDEKTAQIILTASLVNDAVDLDDVALNFVVGFPHFLYDNVETPLASKANINDLLRALGSAERRPAYNYQSVLANQSMMELNRPAAYAVDEEGFKSLEGNAEEDLFFYNKEHVTLKKGERGLYTIFTAQVPFVHIYEVSLENKFTASGYSGYKQDGEERPKVWHSVRLENKTPYPWTTGSGITLQNGKPLGMDILPYTPKTSKGKLKITVAPDIQVSDEEKEIERKTDIKRRDGYVYDLVTIEGSIEVRNYKDKDITLQITKPISGKMVSHSPQAKIRPLVRIGDVINSENIVEWEIPVKAGKDQKLVYQYQAYLRR